jgi:lambda-carrageenase
VNANRCLLLPVLYLMMLPLTVLGQVQSFSTEGHVVYHVEPATVTRGERSIIAACYDGSLLCYDFEGTLRWKTAVGTDFPFDLKVADIDGDGLDECLVPTGGGGLYAFDDTGALMWTFEQEPPLLQAAVLTLPNGAMRIVTGGVSRQLNILDTEGNLIRQVPVDGAIRLIDTGYIEKPNSADIAVVYSRSTYGGYFMRILNAETYATVWDGNILPRESQVANKRYQDILVCDFNDDGLDDVVLSGGRRAGGFKTQQLFAFNAQGERFQIFEAPQTRQKMDDSDVPVNVQEWNRGTYRMILTTYVNSTQMDERYILGQYGDQLLTYHLDGSARAVFTGNYSYNGGAFDPETATYILASEQSGGDGLYLFDLTNPEWGRAFETLEPVGAIPKIESNLADLRQQVETYQPPAYQAPARKTWLALNTLEPGLKTLEQWTPNKSISFMETFTWSEKRDRSAMPHGWDTQIDERQRYDKTVEQLVANARKQEDAGRDFCLWVGHLHDPFYISLEGVRQIVKAAPNTFKMAIFAELITRDAAMQYAVEEHIAPMAELFRPLGKKIFIRNKSIFWSGDSYSNFWKPLLLGGEHADVFMPALEESNSRTAELSLPARLGLWMTGIYDEWGARPTSDNANWSRYWEWSAQLLHSHFLRFDVYRLALGARYWLINRYPDNRGRFDDPTLFMLLDKGLLGPPRREDLLSVSDVAIGMRMNPDQGYLDHGNNLHDIDSYEANHDQYVFDRLDCYWAGANTAPWEFSNYVAGVPRRMSNFLPRFPYGQVAIIPEDTDLEKTPVFDEMLITDGKDWYDAAGNRHSPEAYRPVVEAALTRAAARLPVRVEGKVAWVVWRLDDRHLRVLLVDEGYVNPADRTARVIIQQVNATGYRDVLAQQAWQPAGESFVVSVPMGTFRIIDVELAP